MDLTARAVRLLSDIIAHKQSSTGSWENELFVLSLASYYVPGRPFLNDDHVQVLLKTGIVQYVGGVHALRLLNANEKDAHDAIARYTDGLMRAEMSKEDFVSWDNDEGDK